MHESKATPIEEKPPEMPPSYVEVRRSDLPAHCPMDESKLWNSHPRVFIPVEDSEQAACPYCGTIYKLID